MIGYTKDEFENDLHFQCSYVHPDDIDQASRIMQISKETGEDTVAEGRIITRDGKIKILMMTYSYVSAEESWDGIESFYSVGIDITKDREEQERQKKLLEEAYQAARVASSAKTNFLSSMSHNIRTPMNAIMGMSAIAQANLDSPEKMKDCLKKIDTSSRHLLSLINEVLDMSKIESGKIDLTLEPVNLPELLQSISDICKPLVTEKEQKFQISIGQIRHENIVADGDRLQQILMNLLSNAVKYTGRKGTITLRVNELHSPVPGKSQYEFICADNGIGIPDAFMPSIFEPFSRAEDPRISKLQGTGLGMTITENIVRMMNGTITVESELGSGSKFTVSVPLEHGREEDLYGSDLKGLRVLIVDSSPFVCENAKALLNEAGMLGCWVTSGKDAVSHIVKSHNKKRDYFAVILNQKMPDLDSGEIVRNIRDRLGDSAPVFLAAADDFSGAEEKSTDLWAESLILKPLFKSKMLHALHPFATKNKTDIAGAVEEEGQVDISGKRVLLAEDNDINREIAVELLQMQDVHVDAVENGMRALEVFSASEPGEYHAILMDIQMPVLNGYQATSKIRSLDRQDAQTIPIIALSADAFTADVAKARSLGMNDHIAKPIELNRMLEVLQKWIG